MSQHNLTPRLVGVYTDSTGEHFLPMAEIEISRTLKLYQSVFDACDLKRGDKALLIVRYREAAQSLPLEQAMMNNGIVSCPCEGVVFDAARVEALIRQFNPAALFGVNTGILDGLEAAGHTPAHLFKGRIVWVRDEAAYQRLAVNAQGFTLLRWMDIGPAPAIECVHGGGMHIDDMEWIIEQQADGCLVVSSRLQRAKSFERVTTNVRASVDYSPCACGVSGAKITPLL